MRYMRRRDTHKQFARTSLKTIETAHVKPNLASVLLIYHDSSVCQTAAVDNKEKSLAKVCLYHSLLALPLSLLTLYIVTHLVQLHSTYHCVFLRGFHGKAIICN